MEIVESTYACSYSASYHKGAAAKLCLLPPRMHGRCVYLLFMPWPRPHCPASCYKHHLPSARQDSLPMVLDLPHEIPTCAQAACAARGKVLAAQRERSAREAAAAQEAAAAARANEAAAARIAEVLCSGAS